MSLIINPYSVTASSSLLLDLYSDAIGAYSVRKLRTAYTGSAIRVRRSSDNVESDIGFDSNGKLDESALTTFVGANSAYVTTWYDQSGNGRNATQTGSNVQPHIVLSGTIYKINNLPALKIGVLNSGSRNAAALLKANGLATSFASSNGPMSIFSVYSLHNASENAQAIWSFQYNTNTRLWWFQEGSPSGGRQYYLYASGTYQGFNYSGLSVTGVQVLGQLVSSSTQADFYANGEVSANLSVDISGAGTVAPDWATIGGSQSIQSFPGNLQEMIFYKADKSSDRTGIRDNINTYFGVY